jgi:hypothetical protein
MALCSNCGTELQPSWKFCIKCGTPVPAAAVSRVPASVALGSKPAGKEPIVIPVADEQELSHPKRSIPSALRPDAENPEPTPRRAPPGALIAGGVVCFLIGIGLIVAAVVLASGH